MPIYFFRIRKSIIIYKSIYGISELIVFFFLQTGSLVFC
uniref:Uncharacterized protein n=1 Tax=Setaria italica TaxID=4555 RepID=K3ZFY1_SETIT